MDPSGDGGGGLTATGLLCGSCGTELPPNSKFCNECGASVTQVSRSAEYKQVTVLFADVVHSMDIAATVGPERLREIMTELVNRASAVVQRYGGTVDKFTGDGIMAVFGAPVALEDHAIRACLAALGIQEETARLAAEVKDRDCIDLRLRVGLNSGQVIAGEIGSGPFGYTAVGEQVGTAQRMESVAAAGGVMLSESTARLVEGAAALGESELVQIKAADEPVPTRRLLSMGERPSVGRAESNLVGRRWEMAAVEGLLERVIDGHGAVVTVVGSPGIGKSRLVREVSALATARGIKVFSTFCESHATDVPFRVVARLLRAVLRISGLDDQSARARARAQLPDADPEEMLLLDDLLGIADPNVELPRIDPDARRRRLINTTQLARTQPTMYVIEDAHWIDQVSESMLADFVPVIPQTPSLVLITYRPEYTGALSQVPGAQSIALAPLSDSETMALVSELLGSDPSVDAVITMIIGKAAGNPFFAEEIVRDLPPIALLAAVHGIALAVRAGASGRVYCWAVSAVAAIGVGAFALSFLSLRELMRAIGYSSATAWVFPAIIDTAVAVSTMMLVALGDKPIRRARTATAPAGAQTHSVKRLAQSAKAQLKGSVQTIAQSEESASAQLRTAPRAQDSAQTVAPEADTDFASELIASGVTTQPVETVVAVLAASRGGASINAAAKASGINYRTAQRIVEGAAEHRQRPLVAVG